MTGASSKKCTVSRIELITATLNNKSRNISMNKGAVVSTGIHVIKKIRDRQWRDIIP